MRNGALIGVGNVARNGHLPGWRARDEVALVAAADARPDGREAFLTAYPGARWYESAEEILASETLDFVDVCTPPDSHATIAARALGRGLHVLCEKPLVLRPDELPELESLASARGLVLFTVHNWKHAPAIRKVTDLVASGAVGAVRRIEWETLRTKPAAAAGDADNWRTDPALSGGGVLVDHGWHAFYAVRQWLAEPPRSVAARLSRRRHRDRPIEDTAEVELTSPSAEARILLTWAAPERANRVVIEGSRGRIRLDGGCVSLYEPGASDPRSAWELPSIAEGSHHPDWFGGVVEAFLGEIEDAPRRGQNLAEASLCVRLIAAAQDSNRRGGAPVALEGAPPAETRP